MADRPEVGRILRGALVVGGVSVLAGGAFSLFGARFLEAMVQGIPARDPLSLGVAVGALLLLVPLAALGPARSASRVDPAELIREE